MGSRFGQDGKGSRFWGTGLGERSGGEMAGASNTLAFLTPPSSPLPTNAPVTSMQTAGVSARRKMKNVDAIHFPKQHIASSQSGNLIYRALKCPFVAEWVDRHHKYLAPAPMRASTVRALDNHSVVLSPQERMQGALFPNLAYHTSNTCIFRSFFVPDTFTTSNLPLS